VQRGREEGWPGRERHDQSVRDGQRRGDVQPADDAGDHRRELRGGDGGRLQPATGHVHRHGDGAGVTVRRRTGPADGDGRRTVGGSRGGSRRAHIVPRHTRVQAEHGFCGVRISSRSCRGRTAAPGGGRGIQRRETHTQPGRRRGRVSRQFDSLADGQSAAGSV